VYSNQPSLFPLPREKPANPSGFLSDTFPSVQEQTRPAATTESSLTSRDFGQYLWDVIRDADCHVQAGPQDSPRVFCTQGAGSVASSLSTPSSSRLGEGVAYDDIKAWRPKSEKLSEACGCRRPVDYQVHCSQSFGGKGEGQFFMLLLHFPCPPFFPPLTRDDQISYY